MTKAGRVFLWVAVFSIAPLAAHASSTFAQIVSGPVTKLGNTFVSLLYSLCFIFFLIGMVQYFMSHNAEKRQQGKQFAIYGILALALLFGIWGVVNLLLSILTSTLR